MVSNPSRRSYGLPKSEQRYVLPEIKQPYGLLEPEHHRVIS